MPSPKCAYSVLGIPRSATIEEVKHVYKRLVKLHHPDQHVAAPPELRAHHEDVFKEVTAAYQRVVAGPRFVRVDGDSPAGWYSGGARTKGPFSNTVLAGIISMPLALLGVWLGSTWERNLQAMGRPNGIWHPPVNPYLRDDHVEFAAQLRARKAAAREAARAAAADST